MGGRGAPPKPAHLRQRTNKVAGAARLQTAESARKNRVPVLPDREGGWHPMVTDWWASVWRSPMASEYLDADMRGGLYELAHLRQLFWTLADAGDEKMAKVSAEIRLQEVRFGLSPIDRRRLQWEVERGEQAVDKVKARRKAKRGRPKKAATDPRNVLKLA